MSTEHNPDNLTPEQVGEGWRLLSVGERVDTDDEWWTGQYWESTACAGWHVDITDNAYRRRITPDAGKAEAPAQQPAEAMPETETPETDAREAFLRNHFGSLCEETLWAIGDCQKLERRLTAALAEVERVQAEIGVAAGQSAYLKKALLARSTVDEEQNLRAELSRLREEIERLKIHVGLGHIASLNLKTTEQECQRLTDELSTERAAREQAEVEASGLRMAVAIANKSADDQMFQKRAAEHSLAESESREHQLREELDDCNEIIRRTQPCADAFCDMCASAIAAGGFKGECANCTVADLRLKLETAERERDAVVKDKERLDWLEKNWHRICQRVSSDGFFWHNGERWVYAPTLRAAIDAAIATTQETK